MSGIEIAGLVLGAFPLLLEALDKNREAAEMLADYWNVDKQCEDFGISVNAEYILFEMVLKKFLKPVLGEGSNVDEFIDDPFGDQWDLGDLTSRLREKMPRRRYECYIDKINEFHKYMVALGKELGVSEDMFQQKQTSSILIGNSAPQEKNNRIRVILEYEWHRIRFSVNKKRRSRLLEDLKSCNHYLIQFADAIDISDSSEQTTPELSIGMPLSLTGFWRHAKHLYTLIQQAWCCPCCKSHSTDLLLRNHRDPHKVEFKILFTYAGKLTCHHSGPWDWKEATITVSEQRKSKGSTDHQMAMISAVGDRNTTPPSALRASGTTQRRRKDDKVTFLDQALPKANLAALIPLQVNPALPTITDLCAKLTEAAPDDEGLGILRGNSTHFTVFFPKQKPLHKAVLEHVTLEDVLRDQSHRSLSRRQRYSIALAIASAYVQLHDSPWIWAGWDEREIYLLYDSTTSLYYDQPRMSKIIPTQSPALQGQPDTSLVKLGIILLELAFGRLVEVHPLRQRYQTPRNQQDHFLDKAVAEEWCARDARDEHPDFEEPVKWCFNPRSARTRVDLDDDSWRKKLFKQVVQPLARCCKENKWELRDR